MRTPMARPTGHEGMNRILVPLDFSGVTAEVIELARLLAQSP